MFSKPIEKKAIVLSEREKSISSALQFILLKATIDIIREYNKSIFTAFQAYKLTNKINI